MLQHPVKKSPFKAYITTGFFTFNPLVTEDFFAFGKELTVESRIFQEIASIR